MASFYFPKNIVINNIPVIIYPCIGVEKIYNRSDKEVLVNHLNDLYKKNSSTLNTGNYHIVILWEYEGDRMTDVWIFGEPESWNSGPLVDVKIFRNFDIETNIGVSAGDGLVMLGAEELKRRSVSDFKDYIYGNRADLPDDISPKEEF